MVASKVEIQNLKCGGCANTIVNKLTEIEGIENVKVNEETSEVSFDMQSGEHLEQVVTRLSEIGYPIAGDENTLMKKAKSYVSCAVGRMS
jgi:copper chaperone CopZ